jgi:hypothetical protein
MEFILEIDEKYMIKFINIQTIKLSIVGIELMLDLKSN